MAGYHRRKSFWLTLFILLVTALANYLARSPGTAPLGSANIGSSAPGTYRVKHFVDGDTVAVDMNGHQEKVRLIGVDTPETHKPNTPVQCYGPAAAAYTKNTIGTNAVRLESDPLDTDRDRYGRLLRYVYLPDGTLINKQLITNGYGFYYPYFPFSKKAEFAAAQTDAQAAKRGLWGNCAPTPTNNGGWVSNAAG